MLMAMMMAAALAGDAASAGADDKMPGVPPPVITPQTQVYTHDMLGPDTRYGYPQRAQDNEVAGYATVVCHIDAHYVTDTCVVVDEKPTGYGFGKATAMGFLRAHADPRIVKPDCWLKFTVRYGQRDGQ